MKIKNTVATVAVLFSLFIVSDELKADDYIDSFSSGVESWHFYTDGKATGSLTATSAGLSGAGAMLSYDLNTTGNYVYATRTLSNKYYNAIRFYALTPPNCTLTLWAYDATNQVLSYNLSRPLYASNAAYWYRQVVVLANPTQWWGGANDGVVHYPLHHIALIAGNLVDPTGGRIGQIGFDEVWGLDSTQFTLDPASAPLLPSPWDAWDSSNFFARLAINLPFSSTPDTRALDAATAAGFKWVRMDLAWCKVERTPNVYDWSIYDALMSALTLRGLKPLFILDTGNSLYTGSYTNPPTTDTQRTAFGNFAKAAALHFKGQGVRYEIWNEPDNAMFWIPAPDANQYAAMANVAIAQLLAGDPSAVILTGGLCSNNYDYIRTMLSAGAGNLATGFAIHGLYTVLNPPFRVQDKLLNWRNTISPWMGSKKIWSTESGFSSASCGGTGGTDPVARKRQALLVARELLTACGANFPFFNLYDMRDDGTDPLVREQNFGLLDYYYAEKPAIQAVRTLRDVMANRACKGFVQDLQASTNVVVLRFDGTTDKIFAVWWTDTNGKITISVPANATATDYLGNSVTLTPAGTRQTVLLDEAVAGPIYFKIAN